MQAWKQSESSTPENDPESLINFDPIEQVLYNYNGEVMIGGRIYSYNKQDYDYEIIDDYETSLAKINNGEDVTDDPNIISTNKHEYRVCYSNRRIEDYRFFPNNNNWRVQRRVVIRNYDGGAITHTKAKIISYKMKSNGSWERSRSYIGVKNESKYNTRFNCSRTSLSGVSIRPVKKRRQLVATLFRTNSSILGVEKDYGLKGSFTYGSATNSNNLITTVKYLE